MPLRLVEITIPQHQGDELVEVVASLTGRPFNIYESPRSNRTLLRAVIDAAEVEAIIDPLQSRFAGTDGFHILILPVAAFLPRNEAEEPPEEPLRKRSHRVSREELHDQLAPAAEVTPVYVIMTILSTVVAAIGLARDSGPIVIGAMVIAPLLGPNMVLALATTTGDRPLAGRALRANAVGIATATLVTLLIAPFLHIDPATPEIHARTTVALGDVILALAAGTAGALAFTSGVAASLIGVMVAVALLPPLVVTVLLFVKGHTAPGADALLLLITNIICVNLAATATLALQGVVPRRWWQKDQTRQDTLKMIAFWIILLAIAASIITLANLTS